MGAARWWSRSMMMVLTGGGLIAAAAAPTWAKESAAVAGQPVASTALFIRPTPSTKVAAVGRFQERDPISVACQVQGQWIADASAGSDLWDRLTNGRYVSDVYVHWPAGKPVVPWCTTPIALPAVVPTSSQQAFIEWAATFAVPMQATYQVPAAVTIAQAILESGWGRSHLTKDGHNYFGMKCFGGPGALATSCRSYATEECDGDSCYSTRASFRMYDSPLTSFEDHSRLLTSLSRYRAAFAFTTEPDRFARAIADAGYATSPRYASDLIGLMRDYGLYRFGQPV